MEKQYIDHSVRQYRPRNLTEQQLKFCEVYLAENNLSLAAKAAGYKSPDRSAQMLMKCKRIQEYLNKRQSQFVRVPITFEYKISKLANIIETAIPDDLKDRTSDTMPVLGVSIGLQAIAEANKMQGHYAPDKVQSVNINASIEDIRNVRNEYKSEV